MNVTYFKEFSMFPYFFFGFQIFKYFNVTFMYQNPLVVALIEFKNYISSFIFNIKYFINFFKKRIYFQFNLSKNFLDNLGVIILFNFGKVEFIT